MNSRPTVSVVIPTYNRSHLLGRAIRSVLNQSYQDFEIIVVDDGSTDDTCGVVRGFQEFDGRIRYMRRNFRRGPSVARNVGIRAARGDYIGFLDDDDEWMKEKLEKQIRIFEGSPDSVGVVYTKIWRRWGREGAYFPSLKVKQNSGNVYRELLKWNFVHTPTVLVRAECFGRVGLFDEGFFAFEDWELFIRLSKFYEFRYLDELLVISHCTPGSLSCNEWAIVEGLERILQKHFQDIQDSKRCLARFFYTIGSAWYQIGKTKQGRDYIFKAIKVYPFNFKYFVAAFLSLMGRKSYKLVAKLRRSFRPTMGCGCEWNP